MVVSPDSVEYGRVRLEVNNGVGTDLAFVEATAVTQDGEGPGPAIYADRFPLAHYDTSSIVIRVIDLDFPSLSQPIIVGVAAVEDGADVGGDYTVTGSVISWTELGNINDLQNDDEFTIPIGSNGGTIRLVLTMGDTSANSQNINNVDTGATSNDFHLDSDGNDANGGTASHSVIDLARVAWVGAVAELTASGDPDSDELLQTYKETRRQPLLQATLQPAAGGTNFINPKQVKMAVKRSSDDAVIKLLRPTPSSTGSITTATYNVDTDFDADLTDHDVSIGVNDVLGDSTTPSGEKPDLASVATVNGLSNAQQAWLIFKEPDGGTASHRPEGYIPPPLPPISGLEGVIIANIANPTDDSLIARDDCLGQTDVDFGAAIDTNDDVIERVGLTTHSITGDLSLSIVFSPVAHPAGPNDGGVVGMGKDLAANVPYSLRMTPTGELVYLHDDNTGGVETVTGSTSLTVGTRYGVHIVRDTTAKNVTITIIDIDADSVVETIDFDYTNNPETASVSDRFAIGSDQASGGIKARINVREVRLWDSLVASSTLTSIVNPNDGSFSTYDETPEGTEVAMYTFGEPFANLITNEAVLSVGSGIDFFETASLVTPGADTFEDSGYTTQRDIFRRKLPSSSVGSLAQAVPRFQTFVADANGDTIDSTSFNVSSRRQTDDGSDNLQTISSGSGATAGRLRWNYTIQPTHTAFNRFIKSGGTRVANSHVASGPDDPENAPLYIQSGTVDTIRASNVAPGDRILINDPDSYNIGDRITVDQGGANEATYIVDDIDYLSEELVLTAQTSISHTAGEAIIKNWPVYPRRVRVTGQAFGSNNPSKQRDDQFGINSELHFESIWTGDVPAATIDAQGAPTGKMSRTQSANTGDHRFKLCTAIDASTGLLRDTAEHNPKMVDGTIIDVNDSPSDDLEQRWGAWNATTSSLEQADINSNVELSTDKGYATSPNDGFQALDTSGGSRNIDLVIGASGNGAQRDTLDLTGSPITDTLWNIGETQNGNAGFTGDSGMFGYYSVRVSFFIIDPANKGIIATESATLPPGENIEVNLKTVRFAPDLTFTPVKPDSAPLVIVSQEVPGGEINIVQQTTATAVNPDVNGKSSDWEFTFTPPENGTYSFKFVWAFNGSIVTEGPTVQVQSGTPDPRLRLIGDVGHARSSRTGDHMRAGDIIEFGCNLEDDDETDFVEMDSLDPDGNPSPTLLVLRGIGSGSEEFLDSDETWKSVAGNSLFRHTLTLAGDSKSARIEFQTDDTWGGRDVEAVFVAHRDGARYTDRVIREFVGAAFPHGANLSVSIAGGNVNAPGRHVIPGDDVLIGAALENGTDKISFDSAEVAIRRFDPSLGTIEHWDGASWVTGDTFVYHSMSPSAGDSKIATFTLDGAAVEDSSDLLIRVEMKHTPADTNTQINRFSADTVVVVDDNFQHSLDEVRGDLDVPGLLTARTIEQDHDQPWEVGAMGAHAVRVITKESIVEYGTIVPNTRIYINGQLHDLVESPSVGDINVSQGDLIWADQPMGLVSNESDSKGGDAVAPLSWAGTQFAFDTERDEPHDIYVYAPFAPAQVKLTVDSTDFSTPDVDTLIQPGQVTVIQAPTSGETRIKSTAPIVVVRESAVDNDGAVVPPAAYEVLTNIIAPDIVAMTGGTVNNNDRYFFSDDLFGLSATGDAQGSETESGQPIKLLGDLYVVTHPLTDYRVLSVEPTTVKVYEWKSGTEQWDEFAEHDLTDASRDSPGFEENPVGGFHSGADPVLSSNTPFLFVADRPFMLRTNDDVQDEYSVIGFRQSLFAQGALNLPGVTDTDVSWTTDETDAATSPVTSSHRHIDGTDVVDLLTLDQYKRDPGESFRSFTDVSGTDTAYVRGADPDGFEVTGAKQDDTVTGFSEVRIIWRGTTYAPSTHASNFPGYSSSGGTWTFVADAGAETGGTPETLRVEQDGQIAKEAEVHVDRTAPTITTWQLDDALTYGTLSDPLRRGEYVRFDFDYADNDVGVDTATLSEPDGDFIDISNSEVPDADGGSSGTTSYARTNSNAPTSATNRRLRLTVTDLAGNVTTADATVEFEALPAAPVVSIGSFTNERPNHLNDQVFSETSYTDNSVTQTVSYTGTVDECRNSANDDTEIGTVSGTLDIGGDTPVSAVDNNPYVDTDTADPQSEGVGLTVVGRVIDQHFRTHDSSPGGDYAFNPNRDRDVDEDSGMGPAALPFTGHGFNGLTDENAVGVNSQSGNAPTNATVIGGRIRWDAATGEIEVDVDISGNTGQQFQVRLGGTTGSPDTDEFTHGAEGANLEVEYWDGAAFQPITDPDGDFGADSSFSDSNLDGAQTITIKVKALTGSAPDVGVVAVNYEAA